MLRRTLLMGATLALGFSCAGMASASASTHTLAAGGWHAPTTPVQHFARTVYGGNDGTALDESDVTAMAVDDADGYVFLAAGNPDTYHVEVLTTAGTTVSAPGLAGETDARGLVFSGGLLYVNRCSSGAIDVVDPSTLTVTDTIAIATYSNASCPIAVAGGRIWYQDGATGDLASATVATPRTLTTYPALGTFGARFASNPAVPNELVVTGRQPTLGDSSQTVVLDVSAATPSVTSSSDNGFLSMALSPDGATLYVGGSPSVWAYSVSTFAAGTGYSGETRNTDLPAVSSDGSHVAFGIDDYCCTPQPDVYVYATADGSAPNRTWQLPDTNYHHSVWTAFSGDDSRLYVVTYGQGSARFHLLSGPTLLQSTLSASLAKGTVTYPHTTTLSLHLSGFSTNRTVDIWAQPWSSLKGKEVGTAQVNALTGNVTVAVGASKDTTFWATYDGDAVYGGSVGSPEHALLVRFAVAAKLFNAYKVSNHVHLYHAGTSPVYALGIRPVHRGLCVHFELQVHTSSGWRESDHCFAENRHGAVAVKVTHLRTGKLYRINAVVVDNYHPIKTTKWVEFEVTG